MVERAEKAGFGVALVGHAALFALLSLRLLTPPLPVPPPEQAIEVSLAPDIALRQAAPPAPTPPAASEAPEQGAPQEEAVAEPQPAPVPAPKPAPAPVKAKPAPLKAADPAQAEADRAAKAAARAAWVEKVQAANAAKAESVRVAAEKDAADRAAAATAKAAARAAWVEKVKAANAAKAEAARAAAARAEAARVAANAARAEAAQAAAARADQARAAATARADAARAAAAEKRAKGSRLGKDFLKGLADTPAKTPSAAAPGTTMSTRALADIASAIQRQIQPCALRQVNPAPGQAERIRVTLNLKLNRDGSLAAPPRVINHEGLDVDNRRYIDRVDDLAIAAFVGCAPLRGLPNDLYDVPNGWRSISLRFKLPE